MRSLITTCATKKCVKNNFLYMCLTTNEHVKLKKNNYASLDQNKEISR